MPPRALALGAWLALALAIWPCDAHAYVDPGSGSFITQMIVAAVLGASVTIKIYWRKIKGFFQRSSDKDGAPEDDR